MPARCSAVMFGNNSRFEVDQMAIVRKLEEETLGRDSAHKEVDATYSIVTDNEGRKHLQIDTYGSKERKHSGKKSQSIRFSPEGVEQLKSILSGL